MKITTDNNIFRNGGMLFDTFRKKAKYYFDGNDLKRIKKIEKSIKNTNVWVYLYFDTNDPTTKSSEVCTIPYYNRMKNGYRKVYLPKATKSESLPIYNKVEDFIKDFQESFKNELKLYKTYEQRYLKKKEDVQEIERIQERLGNKIPEYFIWGKEWLLKLVIIGWLEIIL